MAKRHEPEKPVNHERWLLTYADLITLLMIFFVVLYALSKVDAEKFKALSGALAVVFGGGRSLVGGDYGGGKPGAVPDASTPPPLNLRLDTTGRGEEQSVAIVPDAVQKQPSAMITIAESALFEPGSAEIRRSGYEHLKELGPVLTSGPYRIRVEGHTDNVPLRSGTFRSNWQLSAMRAANIVEYLIREADVPPDRILAAGQADAKPVASNATAEGRAKNRRVTILLEPMPGK